MKIIRKGEKAEIILDFSNGKITYLHGCYEDSNKSDKDILASANKYWEVLKKKLEFITI